METYLADAILSYCKDDRNRSVGLFYGDTGLCLSLYLLNRRIPVKRVEKEADCLLDNILNNVRNVKDAGFASGISGIGWALNILLQNKCIAGESNDIFFDIDAMIYKKVLENDTPKYNIHDGKLGYLMYLVSRLKNASNKEYNYQTRLLDAAVRKIINQLYIDSPIIMPDLAKDLYISAFWKYPLLFHLMGQVYDLNIYRDKLKAIAAEWSLYIGGFCPYHAINRIILSISLAELNKRVGNDFFATQIRKHLFLIDKQSIVNETDCRYTRISEGWLFVAFILKLAEEKLKDFVKDERLFSDARKQIITQNKQHLLMFLSRNQGNCSDPNSTIKQNLCWDFINGISGIAFLYSLCPQLFQEIMPVVGSPK